MAEKLEISRGETPQIVCKTPIDLRQSTVYVTFSQDDEIVIERTNDKLTIELGVIGFVLTQEETLALSAGKTKAQIRFKLPNGRVGQTNQKKIKVVDVQKDEVI